MCQETYFCTGQPRNARCWTAYFAASLDLVAFTLAIVATTASQWLTNPFPHPRETSVAHYDTTFGYGPWAAGAINKWDRVGILAPPGHPEVEDFNFRIGWTYWSDIDDIEACSNDTMLFEFWAGPNGYCNDKNEFGIPSKINAVAALSIITVVFAFFALVAGFAAPSNRRTQPIGELGEARLLSWCAAISATIAWIFALSAFAAFRGWGDVKDLLDTVESAIVLRAVSPDGLTEIKIPVLTPMYLGASWSIMIVVFVLLFLAAGFHFVDAIYFWPSCPCKCYSDQSYSRSRQACERLNSPEEHVARRTEEGRSDAGGGRRTSTEGRSRAT